MPSTPVLPPRADSLGSLLRVSDPELVIKSAQSDADAARDLLQPSATPTSDQLQLALETMCGRVAELSTLLTSALKSQSDLETELVVAKSNLQLALANTEMLEEALSRGAGGLGGKDVGWRRWSAREALRREEEEDSRRQSLEVPYDSPSMRSAPTPSPSSPFSVFLTASKPTAPRSAPHPTQESRFFRFRLGGSSSDNYLTSAKSSPMPTDSDRLDAGHNAPHLTSASMPSLVLEDNILSMREAQLQKLLEQERERHQATQKEKLGLESEIEQLSQALFEEANKMVATERKRLAEADDELRGVREEKEALRSALRLVESENDLLRTLATPALASFPDNPKSAPALQSLQLQGGDEPMAVPLAAPVLLTNGSNVSATIGVSKRKTLDDIVTPLAGLRLKASPGASIQTAS